MSLNQDRLKELLEYNGHDFIWKVEKSSRIKIGDIAGCTNRRGYRLIKIDRKLYLAHRLVWLYVHGEFPPQFIDHINGDPSDNRIENLRSASASQNQRNKGMQQNNTSGVTGVGWDAPNNKWRVGIRAEGKDKTVGRFHLLSDAIAARKDAEIKYGFHANHGMPR